MNPAAGAVHHRHPCLIPSTLQRRSADLIERRRNTASAGMRIALAPGALWQLWPTAMKVERRDLRRGNARQDADGIAQCTSRGMMSTQYAALVRPKDPPSGQLRPQRSAAPSKSSGAETSNGPGTPPAAATLRAGPASSVIWQNVIPVLTCVTLPGKRDDDAV